MPSLNNTTDLRRPGTLAIHCATSRTVSSARLAFMPRSESYGSSTVLAGDELEEEDDDPSVEPSDAERSMSRSRRCTASLSVVADGSFCPWNLSTDASNRFRLEVSSCAASVLPLV